ncbi:MAG: signal peptidase I [Eubacteriales bacterium]|nr:signal peptidase I [Eubacteriales bacterium]
MKKAVRGTRRRQKEKRTLRQKLSAAALWAFEIAVVVLFAFVLIYFFGQARTNVGQSMELTLADGDRVLLNTLDYRVGNPKRNDIIAFKPNGSETSHTHIKRVIGLPGETVQIKDGMIYINGTVYLEKTDYPAMNNAGLASDPITLGVKEYFVLGDNRNASEDSRYADIGLVNADYIEGKVWLRISPSKSFGLIH